MKRTRSRTREAEDVLLDPDEFAEHLARQQERFCVEPLGELLEEEVLRTATAVLVGDRTRPSGAGPLDDKTATGRSRQ